MSTQKALIIPAKQAPFEVQDRPVPTPGKGEILVKILATALNPVDWKIQKGGYFIQNFPSVIGSDSAGEVAAVGEGVSNFAVGDKVVHQGWFLENDKSTFQQFAIVPAEIVAKVPSNVTIDEASTIPLGLATAAVGFYNPPEGAGLNLAYPWTEAGRGKYSGQPLVVLGGSSSVGQFAIQLAHLSGFSPIVTTASSKHEAFLKSLGATHVIDRNTDALAAAKSILPGGKAGIVYDAISEQSTESLAIALTPDDGAIILTLPLAQSLDAGSRKVLNVFGNVHAQRPLGISLYSELTNLLQAGDIKPNRVELLPGGLSGIPDGLDRMAANKVSGVKLIVHPWE
ncbi:medium-chain dehydrogenase/reductase like protein [Sistotremastrum suecicum HHB10207 ss-3]|uniref:Medium-chain dehydrogenase/reductase like protein n=1 Tax=Sistotremastrum suecicum HHB10207 ss-3 TaxID=1314776 RepID=A0A165ZYA4_9AGAM|nr:medium-chain dehydrogenase/reductase like protein [Sistotremastrum suecicum HHB10207 ss-3]